MKNLKIFNSIKTTNSNFRFKILFLNLTLFFIFPAFLSISVCAQEDVIKDIAPPPLNIISQIETSQLNAASDLSKHTELSLEFMEMRLKKAETLTTEKKFKESLDELGGFQAIMSNTLGFLQKNDNGKGKVLNNFKRLEINLRKFVPRLELVRRIMPEKFAYHVIQLMRSVRKTRATAVEPLFSDTVVKDKS